MKKHEHLGRSLNRTEQKEIQGGTYGRAGTCYRTCEVKHYYDEPTYYVVNNDTCEQAICHPMDTALGCRCESHYFD